MIAGTIPVYHGAPEIAEFLPSPKAIVNYADFDSVEALARHLHAITRNETLYLEHFQWDVTAPNVERVQRMCASNPNFICDICNRGRQHRKETNDDDY